MQNRIKLIVFIMLLSGLFGFVTSLYMHRSPNSLPLNNDAQVIQTFHSPATFVKQLIGDPEAGKKIFREFCSSCHGKEPLININAPKIDDTKKWKSLKNLGMDHLLDITIKGVGAMPARGGCFECSDEQLRETINYILSY